MSRKPTRQKNMFLFLLLFVLLVTVLSGALAYSKYIVNKGWTLSLNILGTPASYKVNHYFEDLNADTYTLRETETVQSIYKRTEEAPLKDVAGFKKPTVKTITVDDSNSQVINYYYPRNSYLLTLNKVGDVESVSDNAVFPTVDQKPYKTVSGGAGTEIATIYTHQGYKRVFYKAKEGEAYCVLASRFLDGGEHIGILLISKDLDAISYNFKDFNIGTGAELERNYPNTSRNIAITYGNETWYCWGTEYQFPKADIDIARTKAELPYLNEMTNVAALHTNGEWRNTYESLEAAAAEFLELYYANQDGKCSNFYEYEKPVTVTATMASEDVETGDGTETTAGEDVETGDGTETTVNTRSTKWLCWGGTLHSPDPIYSFTMPAKDVSMVAMTDHDFVRVVDTAGEVLVQVKFTATDGHINHRTFLKATTDRAYFTTIHRKSANAPWYSIGLVSTKADGVKYSVTGSHTRSQFGPEGVFVLNDTVYYYSGNLFSVQSLHPDGTDEELTENVYPIPYWADWEGSSVDAYYRDTNDGPEIPVYIDSFTVIREIVNYMHQGGDHSSNDVKPSFLFRFTGNDTHYTEVGEGNAGWTRGEDFVLTYRTSDSDQYVLPADVTLPSIEGIRIFITNAGGRTEYGARGLGWLAFEGAAATKNQTVTLTIPAAYLSGATEVTMDIVYDYEL